MTMLISATQKKVDPSASVAQQLESAKVGFIENILQDLASIKPNPIIEKSKKPLFHSGSLQDSGSKSVFFRQFSIAPGYKTGYLVEHSESYPGSLTDGYYGGGGPDSSEDKLKAFSLHAPQGDILIYFNPVSLCQRDDNNRPVSQAPVHKAHLRSEDELYPFWRNDLFALEPRFIEFIPASEDSKLKGFTLEDAKLAGQVYTEILSRMQKQDQYFEGLHQQKVSQREAARSKETTAARAHADLEALEQINLLETSSPANASALEQINLLKQRPAN